MPGNRILQKHILLFCTIQQKQDLKPLETLNSHTSSFILFYFNGVGQHLREHSARDGADSFGRPRSADVPRPDWELSYG